MDNFISFGIDLNTSSMITHEVTVICGSKQHVFRATCMKDDDEPSGLWEIVDGEKTYDNYVEIEEDNTLTICIDGESTFGDIDDFNADGLDIKIEGTSYDDDQMYVFAKGVLGEEGTLDDVIKINSNDDYNDDEIDDFEIREKSCRFMNIEFGEFEKYCDELENIGFQFVENYNKNNAKFSGWFLNRKCEVEVCSNEDTDMVKYVNVYFTPTRNGRKIVKFYRDVVNQFIEEYGEISEQEDNPSDFDTDELIDAVNSFNFHFRTTFNFYDHSYRFLNDIDISIAATIDENGDDAAQIQIGYTDFTNLISDCSLEEEKDEDIEENNEIDENDLEFANEHPYLNYFELVGAMANQDLLDKTFSAIKDIIDFYEENCFKDDFTELIGQIKPKEDDFTFNNFIKSIFMGDVFSCIAGIGGKLDMKEPPCVIIPMLSLKLESNTDLKNSIQFASINKDFFDSCQGLMDSIMDIRNAIGNYETFVISDIFSYYNKEKQVKYIDLMIRLCRCLIEFKNNNPSESMAFIKHLYQIQKINKGILADEK